MDAVDAAAIPPGGARPALERLDTFLGGAAHRHHLDRDRPAVVGGTSGLSPYLRFGAVSVRGCVRAALSLAEAEAEPEAERGVMAWLDELVWREFYHTVLDAHPRVLSGAFRADCDALLEWDDDPERLEAWQAGRTGYPIVDAGMQQLAATGWMHNRARMIVASFLTKDLHIDWRSGERWFMRRLVDGDPASNNGGWQWAASTGTDAQPYLRIFNPTLQGERFDPDGKYGPAVDPGARGNAGQVGASAVGVAPPGTGLSAAHRRSPARANGRPRALSRRSRPPRPIAAATADVEHPIRIEIGKAEPSPAEPSSCGCVKLPASWRVAWRMECGIRSKDTNPPCMERTSIIH